jgi:hypothetical protein
MAERGGAAAALWVKYRRLTAGRLIFRDLKYDRQRRLLAQGTVTNAVGPYGFRPEALAHARRRVLDAPGGANTP